VQGVSLSIIMLILLPTCQAADSPASAVNEVSATSEFQTKHLTINTPFQTNMPSPTLRPSSTPSASATPSPTSYPSVTRFQSATQTSTPSVTATYAVLRGTVLEQANCRYGPGAAYLYKYGLYADNRLEVIGRNQTGSWIVVQAIGGSNPCWLKASLMDIQGDVFSLAPASLPLPQSPYYGPVTGVYAERNGDQVIISWYPLNLKAGDDSLQYPYLVEAWLCRDGAQEFSPIGSWETIISVTDEAGCAEASHARVYGVEKHGYTAWVNILWPAPESPRNITKDFLWFR
jgi:hypothetical protein